MVRVLLAVALLFSCGTATATTLAPTPPVTPSARCDGFAPPDPHVDATIQHLKTSATVIEVLSTCTVRVRISSTNVGNVAPFNDRVIVLRATTGTSFASASQGDLAAVGRFGLRPGDVFTLSFDSRPFADGSYPINFMNR